MNNVKNDERFFLTDETKKPFSVKLSEDQYEKEFKKVPHRHYEFEINEGKSNEEYLLHLIIVKESLEREIKYYITNCVRSYNEQFNFKKIKIKLDNYEKQLLNVENHIEKRKAISLLSNEYDIKKKWNKDQANDFGG